MKYISLTMLILSTIMIISSNSWMSTWLGLEINMLSFIVYIKEKNSQSSKSMMIYFIIQSMSSMLFIFMVLMKNKMEMINTINIINDMMTLSMMMKIGSAPMHMWIINMSKMIKWQQFLVLNTWQKVAPLYIMSQINDYYIVMVCSMMSIFMGGIGGINQTSLKKIMAFSSTNHLGWMMMCMKYDSEMWIKYLILYTMMLMSMTMMFKMKFIEHINQISIMNLNKTEKFLIMMMFMSLAGMPPFTGFLNKWIVLEVLTKNMIILPMLFMIMMSMITTYYYLRVMSPMFMTQYLNNKWKIKNNNFNYSMVMFINMLLPLTLIFNMI